MSETPVSLRPVAESDLLIFYEQQLEPEAVAMAHFPSRELEPFMAHWANILSVESMITRTILLGDAVAGNIGSWPQDGERLVGYWIGKAYWGKGVATEALRLYLEVVTTRPLAAFVARHNIASRRVLEKNGFVLHHEEPDEFLLKLS